MKMGGVRRSKSLLLEHGNRGFSVYSYHSLNTAERWLRVKKIKNSLFLASIRSAVNVASDAPRPFRKEHVSRG